MSLFCDCSQDHARQKPYNPSESRRGHLVSPKTLDDMMLEIWLSCAVLSQYHILIFIVMK